MDDRIFASPCDALINQVIAYIGDKFDIEYQGTLDDYIGVKIDFLSDRKIKLSQPHVIGEIVQELNLLQRVLPRSTSAKYSVILLRYLSDTPFDHRFHYCFIVGNLKFPDKSMQGHIYYIRGRTDKKLTITLVIWTFLSFKLADIF